MSGYSVEPPLENEIEISLFGPGFGECIVCHLGSDDWVIVDSCKNPRTKQPIALDYLRTLGRDPSKVIKLIVATHFHDDHIGGLATLAKASPNADFAITHAIENREFMDALLPWLENVSSLDGKGMGEFYNVMMGRGPLRFAGENSVLFERNRANAAPCKVVSLSPSDFGVLSAIAELKALPSSIFRTRMPDMKANHSSVALTIQIGSRRILLGGDLLSRKGRSTGWLAVVDRHAQWERPVHEIFKVSHHGSANGDDPEIWEKMLADRPICMLTPFTNKGLPLPSDCERLRRRASAAYLTAPPDGKRFKHPNPSIGKTMLGAAKNIQVINSSFGHVRLRSNLDPNLMKWTVQLDGAAKDLCA